MKHAMNFRLNTDVTRTLTLLEKKLHASKTSIVEEAVLFYAKKKLVPSHPLLQFAGKLSEKEAEKMLTDIKTSKHDKDMDIDL